MSTIYIHYGDSDFRPEMMRGKKHNNPYRNKPDNALWASRKDAEWGWKDWCESEDFRLERFKTWFEFTLKPEAKIFYIDSIEKERSLPVQEYDDPDSREIYLLIDHLIGQRNYDFDKLVEMGYDAVEVDISKCPALYSEMYTWDCDSIAILNPDVVHPGSSNEKEF